MNDNDITIGLMRTDVRRDAEKGGCICPVCDQCVKVYKRRITKTMLRQLAMAYNKAGIHSPIHTKELVVGASAGDFGKFAHWGLIEPVKNDDPKKKTSGMWVLNLMAAKFLQNDLALSKHLFIFNGEVVSQDERGDTVFARDIIENFDYRELMNGRAS